MEAQAGASHPLVCSKDVETVPLAEGGAMIVDITSGRCWQLNQVGAEAWALLQEGATLSTIVDILVARYELAREQIEPDLARIVNDLCAQGLVVRRTSQAPT